MKLFVCAVLFCVAAPAVSLAQDAAIVARLTKTSLTQCRRAQNSYELDFEGTFEIENTSNETILIAKSVDVVLSVTAASSQEQLKGKKYSFVTNQVFGGKSRLPPRLEDLVAIKPGQKASVQIGVVLPATIDSKERERLQPGQHWLEMEFSALPFSLWSLGRSDFDSWQRKWRSRGLLLKEYFLTEPFPLDVIPNTQALRCE